MTRKGSDSGNRSMLKKEKQKKKSTNSGKAKYRK